LAGAEVDGHVGGAWAILRGVEDQITGLQGGAFHGYTRLVLLFGIPWQKKSGDAGRDVRQA